MPINPQLTYEKRFARVQGLDMAYIEAGTGDPIVFLHGNPTSSFLWRNVIPHMEGLGRCIAPDLIGFGDSGKLLDSGPERYTFAEHRVFLDEFLRTVGVTENVTLVLHDWGSALGFDWAYRHPANTKGICYMESHVKPLSLEEMAQGDMANVDLEAAALWIEFRTEKGESLVLEKNLFVERLLPAFTLRELTDQEMAQYRRPFNKAGEYRRPMLTLARQVPFDGDPSEVHDIIAAYSEWMATNDMPKLLVCAEPGMFLTGPMLEYARTWKNQKEVTVKGIHCIQEDSPDEIGEALADWYQQLQHSQSG